MCNYTAYLLPMLHKLYLINRFNLYCIGIELMILHFDKFNSEFKIN